MLGAIAEHGRELFTNPLAIGFVAYLIIGFAVCVYIQRRGLRRGRLRPGELPHKIDAPPFLIALLFAASIHPILFFLGVLFWPLWLLIVWAYRFDDEN